ncbi:hypothetical protein HIM_11758 [Hirsutella minnesotensis 3608]|uniref:Uncharacterized protein n=1 Tax=Hirsutella minnesotensis 3608 TaxID=1043627 RepID=A0A0F7ZIT1_9HYPO|nr:hypothetical protein HIM_11758 [Hirsutella minnesotensis 3608]
MVSTLLLPHTEATARMCSKRTLCTSEGDEAAQLESATSASAIDAGVPRNHKTQMPIPLSIFPSSITTTDSVLDGSSDFDYMSPCSPCGTANSPSPACEEPAVWFSTAPGPAPTPEIDHISEEYSAAILRTGSSLIPSYMSPGAINARAVLLNPYPPTTPQMISATETLKYSPPPCKENHSAKRRKLS